MRRRSRCLRKAADPKGLLLPRARAARSRTFTGISSPYEALKPPLTAGGHRLQSLADPLQVIALTWRKEAIINRRPRPLIMAVQSAEPRGLTLIWPRCVGVSPERLVTR